MLKSRTVKAAFLTVTAALLLAGCIPVEIAVSSDGRMAIPGENKIIIISSHNKDLTENLFDKIIYLKDGIFKIIEQFDDIFMED